MTSPADSFAADINAFAAKLDVPVTLVMRRLALQVFVGVVQKTPVDTGRARASWEIGINRVPTAQAGEGVVLAADEASLSSAVNQALSTVKPGDSIVIANNLPYILRLEQGSSTQAPKGMVAVTLAEIASELGSV